MDFNLLDADCKQFDVEGINNHVIEKHPIVTACGLTNSNRGPVILIMNQYVHAGIALCAN